MPDWLSDIKSVAAVAALIVSSISLAISIRSSNTARAAFRISSAQEERRLRRLSGNLVDALFDLSETHIYYALSINIGNPSDSSNAVSAIELWLDYHSGTNRLTVKIPQDTLAGHDHVVPRAADELFVPMKIEPGNTISGRVRFTVPRELVQPSSIDGHRLTIFDTHQSVSTIDVVHVRRTSLIAGD